MGIVAKLMNPTPGAPLTEAREQAPPDMVAQTQIPLQVSPAAAKALSSTPLVGNSANQRALFRFTMAPAHSHDGLTGDQSHPWHGLHLFNHRQTREPGDHQPSPPTSKGPPRSGTNTIEVWVNSAPQAPQTLADTGQGEANPRLLAPEPGVESNHPHLQQAATQAAGGDGTSREKAERLTRWVHQNIKQTPVVGFPSAKDTLTGGRGDCNDLAALLTALLRTSGIPAQRVYGLKVVRGDGTSRTLSYNLQHHAWVRVWLPHSSHPVEVDPAFNQFPADSLRVRLMEHSPGHAGPIMAFTSALQEVELVEFLRE